MISRSHANQNDELSVSVNCTMESIEALSGFFKLFQFFGLQHFSLRDVINKSQSRRSKIFHFVYFIFLFTVNMLAATDYVYHLVQLREKNIPTKNMLTILIRFSFNVGLVAAIVAGLFECFVNMHRFKMIIALAIRINQIFSSDFNVHSNYPKLRRELAIKFISFFLVTLMLICFMLTTANKIHIKFVIVFLVPMLLVSMVLIAFNFYVQLVNFQLENLVSVVMVTFGRAPQMQLARSLALKALSMRRCYFLICKMAKLVNNVLRLSILIVVTILVIGLISTIYDDLIKQILSHQTKTLFCKF